MIPALSPIIRPSYFIYTECLFTSLCLCASWSLHLEHFFPKWILNIYICRTHLNYVFSIMSSWPASSFLLPCVHSLFGTALSQRVYFFVSVPISPAGPYVSLRQSLWFSYCQFHSAWCRRAWHSVGVKYSCVLNCMNFHNNLCNYHVHPSDWRKICLLSQRPNRIMFEENSAWNTFSTRVIPGPTWIPRDHLGLISWLSLTRNK